MPDMPENIAVMGIGFSQSRKNPGQLLNTPE
jgi:hypothetical protein